MAERAPELASLLGQPIETIVADLAAQGVQVVNTGTVDGREAWLFSRRIRLIATEGRVDTVEAFGLNDLAPNFSAVAGTIAPGVSLQTIEAAHGPPRVERIYRHGETRSWTVGPYVVWDYAELGNVGAPRAIRVHAARLDMLPLSERPAHVTPPHP